MILKIITWETEQMIIPFTGRGIRGFGQVLDRRDDVHVEWQVPVIIPEALSNGSWTQGSGAQQRGQG